jgi:hypothetical protein
MTLVVCECGRQDTVMHKRNVMDMTGIVKIKEEEGRISCLVLPIKPS